MQYFSIMSSFAVLSAISACGEGGRSKHSVPIAPNDPQVTKVFIHGDPLQLLKNAQMGNESNLNQAALDRTIFTVDNIQDFNGFNLANGSVFQQFDPLQEQPSTQKSLEEQNKAADGQGTEILKNFKFSKNGRDYLYQAPEDEQNPDALTLTLAVTDQQKLNLTSISGVAVKPLFYSLSTARDVFSILASYDDKIHGHGIAALYFTRNAQTTKPVEHVDADYNYLLGPGITAAWNGPIRLSICGSPEQSEQDITYQSIDSWTTASQGPPKIGSRDLILSNHIQETPFSDVNNHCILWVNDYLFETVSNATVLGLTIPIIDKTTQQIKAGSIFIARKSFAKVAQGNYDLTRLRQRTVTHEFGHFLGLDHEFDKDAQGHSIPSIMSYDTNIYRVQPHDREAINLLYGDP